MQLNKQMGGQMGMRGRNNINLQKYNKSLRKKKIKSEKVVVKI